MVDRIYDAHKGKGQLMERSTIVQGPKLTLEGIYLRGKDAPAVLVCPAIHAGGGNMEGAVANEIAYAVSYAGHASLRFAWRGQGASEGESIPEGEPVAPLEEDFHAALEHLRDCEEHDRVVVVALRDAARLLVGMKEAQSLNIDALIMVDPPAEVEVGLEAIPGSKFAFFPGEEEMAPEFRESERCTAVRVPNADSAFRRSLSRLGSMIADLMGRPM